VNTLDAGAPRSRSRTARLLAMAVCALSIELIGLLGLGALWVASGFGAFIRTRAVQRAHFRLQDLWTSSLLRAARATVGLQIVVENDECARAGNVVVLGRHVSIGDAAIPAVLFGRRHRLDVRYVLEHDPQWDPCIDRVGERVGHHFVDRDGDTDAETQAIRSLGAKVDARSAAVIFREGTFFSPERKARAVARLAAGSRPELVVRAERPAHLLPPRPAGTLARLDRDIAQRLGDACDTSAT
jgi:1-acyl-sn-glycerol-3-phosphate acyltransferase